jgi:ribosomal protein L12E/L44/L45/RPP1/RPP2
MTVSKDELIDALRLRYDHYSAENVLSAARERAQIADKPSYDAGDVRSLRTALTSVGDRLDKVLAHIDGLISNAPAAAAAAPAPAPAKKDKEQKAEPKAEAKKTEEPKKTDEPKKTEDAKKPEQIETTIVLSGVKAEDGDQVFVCGGFPELGEWDADKARKMDRKGDEWTTTIKVASDAEIAFKFLRRTADGKTVWEDGENRTAPAKARLDATWR